MKRYFIAALAATIFAMPVAAQAHPVQAAPAMEYVKSKHRGPVVEKKVERKVIRKDRMGHKFERKHVVTKRWMAGKRVPHWQRKHVVRDYRHHGLRRPAPGQHWVKVDNDYLLIATASGIIASIIAAH
ncbi:MAG: RcnB family protein [Rhizobiaceae bacterium]|nr:RcnB family protein [Rhizobiaceae bacterium]